MPGEFPNCLHTRIVRATTSISSTTSFFQAFLSYGISTFDWELTIGGPCPALRVFRQPETDWNTQYRHCLMGKEHCTHLSYIPASIRNIQEAWNRMCVIVVLLFNNPTKWQAGLAGYTGYDYWIIINLLLPWCTERFLVILQFSKSNSFMSI